MSYIFSRIIIKDSINKIFKKDNKSLFKKECMNKMCENKMVEKKIKKEKTNWTMNKNKRLDFKKSWSV